MSFYAFEVRTTHRNEFVEVTAKLQVALKESGVTEGLCCVYVPHTTAGVCINEVADPTVSRDIQTHLTQVVPARGDYRHLEGNADAHIKSALIGTSLFIPVKDGKLMLGTWQGVFFCEFDGPRTRQLYVKVLAG
jgi:secondary thiamine-phosphate synthase enzyme